MIDRRIFMAALLGLTILPRKKTPSDAGLYSTHIQRVSVSTNLSREQLFELGKKGPYYRYLNFPFLVTTKVGP